jgi:hypothetical protein
VAWGTLGWPHGDCAGPGVPCPVYQPAGERPRMPDRRWVKCGEELLTLCRRKKTDLYFSISSARATAGQRRWRRHLAYRVRHRLTFGFSSPESPHKRDLSPRSSLAAAGCAPAVIDRAERDQRTTHDPPRMDRASGRPHLPLAPVAMPAGNRVAGSRDDVRKCEPAYRALPSSEATGVGMAVSLRPQTQKFAALRVWMTPVTRLIPASRISLGKPYACAATIKSAARVASLRLLLGENRRRPPHTARSCRHD